MARLEPPGPKVEEVEVESGATPAPTAAFSFLAQSRRAPGRFTRRRSHEKEKIQKIRDIKILKNFAAIPPPCLPGATPFEPTTSESEFT